jgi:hypothetical protein
MRKQVIVIVLITIMALISCTGCDSEIGGTIDLSYDVGTLTSFQWVKELSNGDTEYLTFNVTVFNEETGLYVLNIFDNEDLEGEQSMGILDMSDSVEILVTIEGIEYTMRITSTVEGVITLSLKDSEEIVMYFAPTPLPM